MAKGKTTQPLVVWVWKEWAAHPKIVALAAAGHETLEFEANEDFEIFNYHKAPDLILHPAAWRWGEWAWPYLEQAITEARRAKRAREST